MSPDEAERVIRLIATQGSDRYAHRDCVILTTPGSDTRVFAVPVESPDPDEPSRKVPEVFALITSDRNTWSMDAGQRLRERAATTPRDGRALANEGWHLVTAAGSRNRPVRPSVSARPAWASERRLRGWLARFMGVGLIGGTCAGTIVNDVAGTHGATLWGAPIGLSLGFVAGLVIRAPRKM
jgi:hypothetical protein